MIFAPGGTTPINFLHTLGIAFNGDGPVFDEADATNVAGLYLIGDLVVSATKSWLMLLAGCNSFPDKTLVV